MKVELNFTSKMLPSRLPAGTVKGREVFFKVRQTTAILNIHDGKNNSKYTSSVVCNVNDQDSIILGQKHATKKLLDTMGGPASDKAFRALVWATFAHRSNQASKIMN